MKVRLALLAITAAGLALRLFHLGGQSLWVDEAVSLRFARYPLDELVAQMLAHHEVHPPLYDAALHVWSEWGQSETWIRLPSVLAGTLCIPLVYWLSREFDIRPIGALVAAALLALSSFAVFLSQEVRSYPFAMALTIAATALFARLLREPRPALAVAWGLVCVVGFYVHYLTVLLWPCFLLAAGMQGKRAPWRLIFLGLGVIAACLLPWMRILALQATSQDRSVFRAPQPIDLIGLPLTLLYGTAWVLPPAWICGLMLALPCLLAVAGARGRTLLATSALLPSIMLLVVSTTTAMHMFWARYAAVSLPSLLVLMAAGLVRRPRVGIPIAMAFVAINLWTLCNLFFDARYQNQDWRSVCAFAAANTTVGDAIVVVPSMMTLPVRYYYHGPAEIIGVDERDDSGLAERLRGAPHIWLIEPPEHPLAARAHLADWLDGHAVREEEARTDSVHPDNIIVVRRYGPMIGK